MHIITYTNLKWKQSDYKLKKYYNVKSSSSWDLWISGILWNLRSLLKLKRIKISRIQDSIGILFFYKQQHSKSHLCFFTPMVTLTGPCRFWNVWEWFWNVLNEIWNVCRLKVNELDEGLTSCCDTSLWTQSRLYETALFCFRCRIFFCNRDLRFPAFHYNKRNNIPLI